MDKKALRQEMLARRSALEPEERERLSRAAQEALVGSGWFQQARLILLYDPIRGEVGTEVIAAAALAVGKRLALPRVQRQPRRLWLHAYPGDPGSLVTGAYGILEPDPSWPLVAYGEVDMVVVPGLAFDHAGTRLGYGGGYYDRLLPDLRAANPAVRLIGLAYGFQVVNALPRDPHDVAVDGVCTEPGTLSC